MSMELKPCPNSPNCVSSQSENKEHSIAPLKFIGDASVTRQGLLKVIKSLPRTHLISETEQYLHFTFTSLVFRFVDDVEFFIDEHAAQIHVRSASRVGYSDLGVNRKRVEHIRQLLAAQEK